jgi:phage shock protein A
MGILSRASYVVRSKVNALLNRAEDPTQTLDYSYEQLQDELQNVKKGIADLTTQKKRLEIQKRRLDENVEKHNEQARQAVRQDRDDLARRALEKKKQKMTQIERIEDQVADLEAKQDRLIEKKDELQGRIEEFRTRKETMKARYQAAEASARVEEAMTGAGDEMGDINRTIERAEERTEDMEARAAALDELREKGALEDGISDRSQLDRELEELSKEGAVDAELETLKAEVDAGETESETGTETGTGAAGEDGTGEQPPAVEEAEVESELDDLREEER